MLSLTLNEVQWSQFEVASPSRPMFGPVETADGYVMIAIASEKTFQSLVRRPAIPNGSAIRVLPNMPTGAATGRADGRRRGLVAHAFDRACLAALNGDGVPSSAYRTVAEALADPQIAHRGALAEVEDDGGTFKVLNLPFRMSGADVSAGKRMSTLGEHTVALLKETGLSEAEIAAFSGNRRWPRSAEAGTAGAFVSAPTDVARSGQ